jgi:hypothetical protein
MLLDQRRVAASRDLDLLADLGERLAVKREARGRSPEPVTE